MSDRMAKVLRYTWRYIGRRPLNLSAIIDKIKTHPVVSLAFLGFSFDLDSDSLLGTIM